jgi:transposase-like protein
MTDISISDRDAARWAARLEDGEKDRTGHPLAVARQAVARRLKIPPGTLENLRRGRSKGVRIWIYETLRAAMVRELEQEQRRLDHELEILRQMGGGAVSGSIGEMEKHLEAVKGLIAEGKAA